MSRIIYCENEYKNLSDIDWDFKESKQPLITSIHPYPAKFIIDIPRSLIETIGCPENTSILDPFCGSGTTLLTAAEKGYSSYGIDLNPIACLITKCKLSKLPNNFLEIVEEIIKKAKNKTEIVQKEIPNLNHWFSIDIQKGLSSLVEEIESTNDRKNKDFLSLALSSIIVRVSYQESDTRYAAISKNYSRDDVYIFFRNACKKIYKAKNETILKSSKNKIFQRNILEIKPSDFQNEIGLIITSPPYPNAYEYWLYHKYRMWWLGYDPITVRNDEIGARPHYQKKNGLTEQDFQNQMNQIFNLFNEILERKGHICFIVGRSIIKGREIDNSQIITNAANLNGFSLKVNIERNISSNKKAFNQQYGKLKTENILVYARG